jgi:arylsulfatase A-like enzyme
VQLPLRLIGEDPGESYNARAISRAKTVFYWPFLDEKSVVPWRSVNLDLRTALAGGVLRVRFPRPDFASRPYIFRPLDLAADAIDAVEVETAGPRRDFRSRGSLQLYWSGPDQPFAEERSLSILPVQQVGAYHTTYSLPVARHPLWRGRVAQIRIDPTAATDDTVDLRSIRGVKYETAPELVAEAAARPWKVDLGGDLRPARLAWPGRPVDWRIQVPYRSILRFGYGMSDAVPGSVRFSVTLREGNDSRQVLFEDVVQPRPGDGAEWRDAVVDLARFAGVQGSLVFEVRPEGAFDLSRTAAAWASPSVWPAREPPRAPNVVVVSLDTLRKDRVSVYGSGRRTTPRIDDWARRRATIFETAVASAPWTLPSHASIFTGLDALRHGVNHGYPVPRSLDVMAELFRRAGYSTVGVTGGAYVGPEYGFDRGFDSYYSHPAAVDGREMEKGVDRCLRFLDQAQEPFFLFFHTYAVHAYSLHRLPALYTYRAEDARSDNGFQVRFRLVSAAPGAEGRLAGPADFAAAADLYDASVAYADEQLGRLLRELESRSLGHRTIVVVTSDHGEALGEKGLAAHAYLYDFNLLVPLLVAAPDGRGAGRRVAAQVRSIDILPTVLELAGLPPRPRIDGSSLVTLMEGRPEKGDREALSYAASTNFGLALRSANVKYVFNNTAWRPACGDEQLFDLAEDPDEERSLPSGGEAVERLRGRARDALQSRSSGLLVELFNGGGTPLAGTIDAPFLHQNRTKGPGAPCGDTVWNAARGGIDFRVAPGQGHRLLIEGVGPGAVTLTLSHGSRPYRASLEPRQLSRPWQVAFDGSSWRTREEASGSPATGVKIQWVGDVRVEGVLPEESNPDLRERLKALGYLQ